MRYRSGLWPIRLGLGGSLYTTQGLYGRERKPGSGLLKPEQEGSAVLGEAFADLRVTARIMARLFRHTIDFKPSEGMLRGLWVRARAAFVDEKGPDAQHLTDYRLILNYELPLL